MIKRYEIKINFIAIDFMYDYSIEEDSDGNNDNLRNLMYLKIQI